MIGDDLGNAEVEHLELGRPVRVGDEDVRRIQIAVNDALRVRERHRVGDRIEQAQDLGHGSPLLTALPSRAQLFGEGVALEPLEHHIGHQRAGGGGHGRAGGDGSRDVERAARQPIVDLALVAKASNERLDHRRAELGLELEAFDGDRLVEADVHPGVDDAESPFPDGSIDAKLPVEHLTNEAVKIRCRHEPTIHTLWL